MTCPKSLTSIDYYLMTTIKPNNNNKKKVS